MQITKAPVSFTSNVIVGNYVREWLQEKGDAVSNTVPYLQEFDDAVNALEQNGNNDTTVTIAVSSDAPTCVARIKVFGNEVFKDPILCTYTLLAKKLLQINEKMRESLEVVN